jgi:methylglyoxal synthase
MKVRVFNSQSLGEIKEINLALATKIDYECTVGRSPNSGLVLDSPDVSRLHGKFFLQNGNYYFSDLGSRNGSIVNGRMAQTNQSHMLKAGDVVRIGEFVLIMEDIIPVPEELPATVFGGIDATVIAGWRSDLNTPEVASQAPAEVSEVPEVMAEAPEAISVPEKSRQSPEVVSEVPEQVSSESEVVTPATEEVSEASEVTSIQDLTIIQAPEEPEVVIQVSEADVLAQTPEAVSEVSETTDVQAPSVLEEAAIAKVVSQAPEEVVVLEVNTTSQAPEAVNEVPETTIIQDLTIIQAKEAAEVTDATDISCTEAVSEVSEPATRVPEAVSETPEAIASSEEAVSEAPRKEEAPEVVTQLPEEISSVSEVTSVQYLTSIQIPESAEVFEVITQTPSEPEAEAVTDATTIQVPEGELDLVTQTPEADATDVWAPEVSEEAEVTDAISHAPEAVTEVPEVTSQASESAEVSEVMAQTPEPVNEVPEMIAEKYIALMAHDSKKTELAQFVAKHQELLSKCLTIATPSISETLYQQTGLAISYKTPVVPVGGYQTIASFVGSGDILAVILLRDLLVPQSGQANEEALLRLCTINQILFATNVPTAEAIVHYIKDMVKS